MPYDTIAVAVSSIICVTLRESDVWSSSSTAIGMSRATPLLNSSAKNANDTTGSTSISTKYIGWCVSRTSSRRRTA
jgi:hypothetical protein